MSTKSDEGHIHGEREGLTGETMALWPLDISLPADRFFFVGSFLLKALPPLSIRAWLEAQIFWKSAASLCGLRLLLVLNLGGMGADVESGF